MQRSISLRGFNDPVYQSRSVYETHHVPGQHGGQHGGGGGGGGRQQQQHHHPQQQHHAHHHQHQIYGHVPRQRKRAILFHIIDDTIKLNLAFSRSEAGLWA